MRKNDDYQATASEFPARIKPGIYEAICISVEYGRGFGKEMKCYVIFKILGTNYDGKKLFMAFVRYDSPIRWRSKQYTQWSIALGRQPYKGERFSKKVFINRLFEVKVEDSHPKNPNGSYKPDFLKYSIVSTIIRPLTGGGMK